MRKLILAAALASASAFATPAAARDGSPYVGIDAGIMKPDRLTFRYSNPTTTVRDALELNHKNGFDGDLVGGYDFGLLRAEVEIGYKHARLRDAFISRSALTAAGQPLLANNQPAASGHASIISAMVNGLIDLWPSDQFTASIGLGIGEARTKYNTGLASGGVFDFTGSAQSFAYQALFEARVPISPAFEVGVTVRHFQTNKLDFGSF